MSSGGSNKVELTPADLALNLREKLRETELMIEWLQDPPEDAHEIAGIIRRAIHAEDQVEKLRESLTTLVESEQDMQEYHSNFKAGLVDHHNLKPFDETKTSGWQDGWRSGDACQANFEVNLTTEVEKLRGEVERLRGLNEGFAERISKQSELLSRRAEKKDLYLLEENERLSKEAVALYEEVEKLRGAIRTHRDQRGDNRCWLDDETLYSSLPEGYIPPERDTTVELFNCMLYVACRHNPKTEYVSPQRRIEELEATVKKLEEVIRTYEAGL